MYILPDGKGKPKDSKPFKQVSDIKGVILAKDLPKPIRKQAPKRAKQNREYLKIKKVYLAQNPKCTILGCENNSIDVHHMAGKIEDLLTDTRYFKAVCRNCHIWIENHPNESKKLGYSLTRIDK